MKSSSRDRDKDGPAQSQASADLLDLVRDAEDAAKLDTAAAAALQKKSESYVDVDDEAIDAPPSLAPFQTPSSSSSAVEIAPVKAPLLPTAIDSEESVPASTTLLKKRVSRAPAPARAAPIAEVVRPGLPPIVAIAIPFGLAILALFLLAR